MRANYKNKLPESTKRLVAEEVEKEYAKTKKEHELKIHSQVVFMCQLAAVITLNEEFDFGPARRERFLSLMTKKANEISDILANNKVFESSDNTEHYDIAYNREFLSKLSEKYNVSFNEEIFDDVC